MGKRKRKEFSERVSACTDGYDDDDGLHTTVLQVIKRHQDQTWQVHPPRNMIPPTDQSTWSCSVVAVSRGVDHAFAVDRIPRPRRPRRCLARPITVLRFHNQCFVFLSRVNAHTPAPPRRSATPPPNSSKPPTISHSPHFPSIHKSPISCVCVCVDEIGTCRRRRHLPLPLPHPGWGLCLWGADLHPCLFLHGCLSHFRTR